MRSRVRNIRLMVLIASTLAALVNTAAANDRDLCIDANVIFASERSTRVLEIDPCGIGLGGGENDDYNCQNYRTT